MKERRQIVAIRPFLVNGQMVAVDQRPFEMAEPHASEAIARGDAKCYTAEKFAACPAASTPEASPKNAAKQEQVKEKK